MTWSGSSRAGQGAYEAFGLAAALSATAGGLLPDPAQHTSAGRRSAGAAQSGLREALELIRRPVVAVFLATAFGVGLTTPFVYQVMPPYLESRGLPRAWISTVMTLGQYPEIATLAALPWLFRRLRYKGTLALGIAAYVVRYASLALDPPLWVAIAGIPLHGVGIACFNVGGPGLPRQPGPRTPPRQRPGAVDGAHLGDRLAPGQPPRRRDVTPDPGRRLTPRFLIPCLINLGVLVVFFTGFHPDTERKPEEVPTRAVA